MFDAPRIDYSLKRIEHYTGAPWADVQPWILFTNYQRYVDEFVRWAAEGVKNGPKGWALSCPGKVRIEAGDKDAEQKGAGRAVAQIPDAGLSSDHARSATA